MRDRVAIVLTAATAALHLAVANRYDLFRDELYFIVCGRYPAAGYADQPPLVPVIAATLYALGQQTWLVRLPAVLAAAALVWVVVAFVRLAGGRDGAAWIAGSAAAFAPMLMGLTATLNTTTFEPLAWTLVAYGIARALLENDERALLWTGVVAGTAMEAKYALPLWLIAIGAGLALEPERRIFRNPRLWAGFAIAVVIALPSVIWQAAHGFPFVELVRNAGDKDVATAPAAFVLNQVLVLNPLFAPVWLCGLIGPFVLRDMRALRFIPIAFVIAALAIIAGHGKDYYLAAAYPPLFVLGGITLERAIRYPVPRAAYLVIAVTLSLLAAPLALPVLAPQTLLVYQQRLHLTPDVQERGDTEEALPPTFADMLGWRDFVAQVGRAYRALPASDRAGTAILVDNYGEAAALDVYGAPYGLPPALSGHNQYYLLGLRAQRPVDLLRVQRHPDRLRPYCRSVTFVGTTRSRFARGFENGKTIALCRGVHPGLAQLWPTFKLFI